MALYCCVVALAMAGCKAKKDATATNDSTASNTPPKVQVEGRDIKPAKAEQGLNITWQTDPFQVDTAWVRGNVLLLNVTYSGGCQEHVFELQSDLKYMKSMPPKLPVFLQHNGNRDHCRSMERKELAFDISGMKYAGGKTVMLRINNYDKEVRYDY